MDISIIIPYNKDRGYLKEAIKSATDQDFRGTFEIIPWFGDYGVSKNINDAVKYAVGEWIKFFAEDDILLPNCLTDLWNNRNGFDIMTANSINFYPDGTEINIKTKLPETLNDIVLNYGIHGGGTMYKRQVLLDNPMNENLWTGEEWELNCRLFQNGYKFGYVDKTVYKYRIHDEMKSGQNNSTSEYRLKRMLAKEEIKRMFL